MILGRPCPQPTPLYLIILQMSAYTPLRQRRRYIISVLITICLVWYLFLTPPEEVTLNPKYGVLKPSSRDSRLAFATMLSDADESEDDFYYVAIRVLAYQLLHDEYTRSNKTIPFIVLATPEVPLFKQERLRLDGATVIQVQDVPHPRWIKTGITRWKDQFAKLRLFEMVEYDRILYMDADTLLTRPIDSIFDEEIVRIPATTLPYRKQQIKKDEASLPANYVFAARSNNEFTGQRDHPFPPPLTELFSAGFWIVAPSKEMFAYFISVMQHWRRFDPTTMEQSLLNYAFRREGAMPWLELDYRWSATWPNIKDFNEGVASLHEKLEWGGPQELRELWRGYRKKMEVFFSGEMTTKRMSSG
jgi:alpha-N-acetylglucosamine transferase